MELENWSAHISWWKPFCGLLGEISFQLASKPCLGGEGRGLGGERDVLETFGNIFKTHY